MSFDKEGIQKLIVITSEFLGGTFLLLKIIGKLMQGDSVYKNEPHQKNPFEGKRVVFVQDDNDPENADGVRGHLEIIGDSDYRLDIYDKSIKRIIDVVLSFGGLVILFPVFAGIAVAIKIDDPGPILFVQKRVGKNKQYYKLHKFRTMKMSAPHNVPTHQLVNPEQYITRTGRFLRAHSLDELPQIWDIFLGNMSVIGPRPGLWNQVFLIAERDRYGANEVKPGLTGWAQINGRDELEISMKAKLDGEYVRKESLIFDAMCFIRTVSKVGYDDSIVEGGYGGMKKSQDCREDGLVSIIMPSYNTEYFIGKSIQSVLEQTYTNWELIIVDDCSDDGTKKVLSKFMDDRIKIYYNKKNSGAAVSRNIALKKATGKWVAFLDSDDLWKPTKLESQIKFMKANGYHFSYTNYVEIDEDDFPIGTKVTGPKKVNRAAMYAFNFVGCLTVMYDREYVGLIQIKNLKKRNDYALWVKIVQKCPAYLLDECLAQYRIRKSGSIMDRSKTPISRMKYNYYLWNKGENMGKIPALALTGINLIFGAIKAFIYKRKAF